MVDRRSRSDARPIRMNGPLLHPPI